MIPVMETALKARLEERRQRLVAAARIDASAYLTDLLGEVDAALARFEAGTYGQCDSCHEPIEEDRLSADPLVRLCLDHLTPSERRALERDLELAAHVQSALLPPRDTVHGGWESHYDYRPLGTVSGDHCDVAIVGDDLVFLLADVSGKGVSASILAAHLQAVFRSLVALDLPLAVVTARVNHLLCSSTPASHYATAVIGRLRPRGTMELFNAGHCPPMLRQDGEVTRIEATGLPLGLFSSGEFVGLEYDLTPGDLLFLYTDGISDTFTGQERGYDIGRIEKILTTARDLTAEQTVQACLDDFTASSEGGSRTDDLTLMAVRRTG